MCTEREGGGVDVRKIAISLSVAGLLLGSACGGSGSSGDATPRPAIDVQTAPAASPKPTATQASNPAENSPTAIPATAAASPTVAPAATNPAPTNTPPGNPAPLPTATTAPSG